MQADRDAGKNRGAFVRLEQSEWTGKEGKGFRPDAQGNGGSEITPNSKVFPMKVISKSSMCF